MIINGKKVLSGGTFAVSAAALAVGSVALATQPKIPETSMVEKDPVIIPIVEEKPTIKPEDVHKWISDGVDQTKREINEEKEKEFLSIKQETSKAMIAASLVAADLKEIIREINRNTKIFNENFVSVDQKLTQALNKFAEKEAEYVLWKADIEAKAEEIEKKHKEIKELYSELKTIKGVSDWGTASKYVQDTVRAYVNTKIKMEEIIKKLQEKYPELLG